MAHEIVFRLPGNEQFSYVELKINAASTPDLRREVADLDENLFTAIGNAFARAVAFQALGNSLGAQVISDEPSWPTQEPAPWEAQEDPQATYGAFQAPTYQQPPQQAYAPPQQPWQQPQAPQASPPGQQAPVCAHGPAKYVPAGVSKATNKPYNAFWACQAPKGVEKCKLPRP